MISKKNNSESGQRHLYKPFLREIVCSDHPLVKLADSIDWESFHDELIPAFSIDKGRTSLPVRLMVGLHYLKYTYDLSDEGVLEAWLENPYWQYFTGGEYFEHELLIDSSSLTRWRKYLKKSGAEKMLQETIKAGLKTGVIKPNEFKRVIADTTSPEKDIRFPTDARLYDRMRETLVKEAKKRGIELRQSYRRVGAKALRKQSGYARARQMRRAKRQTEKLRTYLGRVIRDIERKQSDPDQKMVELLGLGRRLLEQKRDDKNKLYSIHEPEVKCLCKGKAHKRYEFGCKAGFVTSLKNNWILGAMAFPSNPWDGHTLQPALAQVKDITGFAPEIALCDLGYKGHNYKGDCTVQIVDRFRKKATISVKRLWKRRSAIEPVIGHVKEEHRLNRNRLKGTDGDELNVIFAGAGFNLRKLLRAFAQFFVFVFQSLFGEKIEPGKESSLFLNSFLSPVE
jgi:IS5 family transposase